MESNKLFNPSDLNGQEQFRLLVSSVKDYAIFMLDISGNVRTWNLGAEKITGFSARDIIGKDFSFFFTAEDKKAGKPGRELRVAESEGRYEEEGLRVRKDGTTFWANVVLTPVFNEGKLAGYAKVIRDITDKKQNLEKQLQNEVRFRHLVSNVKDYAIFLLSPEGYIVSWNEGAERLKGYKASEIIGKHFSKFYSAEDAAKPERELQTARVKGSCEDEGWRIRKDGTRFWANVIITTIKDDEGNFTGFSKVTRDLTERKKMEEDLKKANEDLELKVKERTKELEESNSELQQFAFIASHDLQEPLRMVSTYLQYVSKRTQDKLDEEDKKYIGFAVKGALRMKLLIEDILAFAQIGRVDSKAHPIGVTSVVHDVKKNLEALIAENGAKIIIGDLPAVRADTLQIVQLFQNLIGNAIKYRSEKPPEIFISAEDQGKYWCFSVKDNGIGISPEYKERIFVVFQRLHSDREKFPGTGIGLAICKKIVERHGGRIWVESQLGEGSTFSFTFPKMPFS
jgi:PAS domain S-box-containing protein